MTKQDFILSLVRSGLWQTKMDHFDMSPYEYSAVMEEAEKQCVVGLVIDCLKQNNMGLQKKCVIHMMKTLNALERDNRRLDENVIALHKIFEENNIKYVVVKGQVIAALYPHPHMRVPGDIDFYVPNDHFNLAANMLNKSWNLNLKADLQKMHQDFKYNSSHFEMHRFLKYYPIPKRQKRFNDIIDNYPFDDVTVNGIGIKTLNPTIAVFYTFAHLYVHFIKMGVALRQVCDVAVLLHHFKEHIDRDLLRELLGQFGLTRAFNAVGGIMTDKLGLPEEEFPWEIGSKDRRNGRKALKLIWKHGNWGKYERSYNSKNKNLKYLFGKTFLRLHNLILFFHLSPKENAILIFSELPYKIINQLRKVIKR